jgi:hypothetical protein
MSFSTMDFSRGSSLAFTKIAAAHYLIGTLAVLHKANILRVDAKTLPACVEPVLADHTVTVPTHPAGARARPKILGMRVPHR